MTGGRFDGWFLSSGWWYRSDAKFAAENQDGRWLLLVRHRQDQTYKYRAGDPPRYFDSFKDLRKAVHGA